MNKPDERQISVTIGHGLDSHLNHADDRNEHPDEPKPAHGHKGLFASQPHGRHGKTENQHHGKNHQHHRPNVPDADTALASGSGQKVLPRYRA